MTNAEEAKFGYRRMFNNFSIVFCIPILYFAYFNQLALLFGTVILFCIMDTLLPSTHKYGGPYD